MEEKVKVGDRIDVYKVIDNDDMPLKNGAFYAKCGDETYGPLLIGEKTNRDGWYLRSWGTDNIECTKVGTLIITKLK